MILRRFSAIAFGAAVVAVASAAPAAAIVPPADGYYTFNQEGAPAATWQLQSVCIQANGTRAQSDYSDETIQAEGCNVIMASTSPSKLTREDRLVNFNARAVLTGGLWTFQFESSEGTLCPDGSTAASTEKYAFDSATYAGTHTSIHGAVCGGQAGMTKTPFTLGFTGGLQPPAVDRFPDHCDYLVGRPSICS
jgi:opacity protein-like surface antigen